MTESKYCTTYCKKCKRLVAYRSQLRDGRKTVLCRLRDDAPPHIMFHMGPPPRNRQHAAEKHCPYYLPKDSTSYVQLALESRRITEKIDP